jgi:hypothetical protein
VSAEYWTGVRLSILNSLCHCPAVWLGKTQIIWAWIPLLKSGATFLDMSYTLKGLNDKMENNIKDPQCLFWEWGNVVEHKLRLVPGGKIRTRWSSWKVLSSGWELAGAFHTFPRLQEALVLELNRVVFLQL